MANKKISFEIDIDGKPIDVVIDKSLNLKQAFRELTKELNRTKEGTKEFEILSTKLGDVKDNIDKTNAKSKDFFGSLSMLPGPVGNFSNAVDNSIGSLKTFTSFSFKDLKFQLGETLNDFKDVGTNIAKATGLTKIYEATTAGASKTLKFFGVSAEGAATASKAFGVAISGLLAATGLILLTTLIQLASEAWDNYSNKAERAAETQKKFNEQILNTAQSGLDAETQILKKEGELLIARAKARGASNQEIYNLEQSNRNLEIQSLQRYYDEIKNIDEKEANSTLKNIKNLQYDIKISEANFQNEKRKNREDSQEKEYQELLKKQKEAQDKEAKELQDHLNRLSKIKKGELVSGKEYNKEIQEQKDEEQRKENERTNAQILALQSKNAIILTSEKDLENQKVQLKQETFDQLAFIFGRETALGRAALIAKQIISAKELVMEIKNTIAFSKLSLAKSKVAIVAGTAQTAKVGFPQNIPLLIGYAAQAAAIISAITSAVSVADSLGSNGESSTNTQSAPNFGRNYEKGGMIKGKRHYEGGTIIEAEDGEAIMTRGSVTMFRPLLSMMNQMGGGTSFSSGAIGGSRFDAPAVDTPALNKSPQIVKTYVVSNELTTEAEKQAKLKNLSTL
jgi:hypothetical protein